MMDDGLWIMDYGLWRRKKINFSIFSIFPLRNRKMKFLRKIFSALKAVIVRSAKKIFSLAGLTRCSPPGRVIAGNSRAALRLARAMLFFLASGVLSFWANSPTWLRRFFSLVPRKVSLAPLKVSLGDSNFLHFLGFSPN